MQKDVGKFETRSKSPQPEVVVMKTNPVQVQSNFQFGQVPVQTGVGAFRTGQGVVEKLKIS